MVKITVDLYVETVNDFSIRPCAFRIVSNTSKQKTILFGKIFEPFETSDLIMLPQNSTIVARMPMYFSDFYNYNLLDFKRVTL